MNQIYIPPEGPPQNIHPNPLIYQAMGEDNIYRMLEDFYECLGKSEIKEMFQGDLKKASQRSAAFFVFILGGPPLYHQQFGHPRMRQRHLPFRIDEKSRQAWLNCFKKTLIDADKKYQFPMEYMDGFLNFLERFSGWMVNSQEVTDLKKYVE